MIKATNQGRQPTKPLMLAATEIAGPAEITYCCYVCSCLFFHIAKDVIASGVEGRRSKCIRSGCVCAMALKTKPKIKIYRFNRALI